MELELEEYSPTVVVTTVAELDRTNSSKNSCTLNKVTNADKIDDILLEAIDEVLSSLGEPVKNAVYTQLQCAFQISKEDIPKKIGEFADFIQIAFGGLAGVDEHQRGFVIVDDGQHRPDRV